jgi:EmrB/QacA subfamily drug resistance transporter
MRSFHLMVAVIYEYTILAPSLLVPLIVGSALLIERMDATIIATSLPELARHFGYDVLTLKLALTSYVISLAIFIPISGWLADKIGARTVFRSAMLTFMLGSVMCALSTSLWMFVIARFLQGVGGAMMLPIGRLVIFRSVSKEEFVKAISFLAIPSLIGPVIGPPLGGFITTYFHWRWIFVLNVPICLLGLYFAGKYIQNFRESEMKPLDVQGFILSAGAGGLLMSAFSFLGSDLIPHSWVAIMFLVGAVMLYLCYRHSLRVEAPLIDFRLFAIPSFKASVLGGSLFRFGLGAVPFLLPLALQEGLNLTPFHSGMITCASAFGALFMKALASSVLRRFGFRRVLMVNAVFAGMAIAVYSLFTLNTPYAVMFSVVLLGGFFPSLQFTCLNALAYADIKDHDAGAATSLASVVQQLSLGMGVVIAGLVIQITTTVHGHATLMPSDFWPAFLIIGLFPVLSVPLMRQLPPNAGMALTKVSK